MTEKLVLPGSCLGPTLAQSAGENVHVKDTLLYSAVLGTRESSTIAGSDVPAISVRTNGNIAPYVGATVFAQVAKISRKQADCNIIRIDDKGVSDGYKGVIMNNNIHESKTIDSTIYEWFKPGDYVKAKVISVSDPKQVVLTTAQRDLGVVKVDANEEMIPISWKFFLGTKSGKVEKRLQKLEIACDIIDYTNAVKWEMDHHLAKARYGFTLQ